MNESDREKLQRLVREAEATIFLRRAELGDSIAAYEELSAMVIAIVALRSIRAN